MNEVHRTPTAHTIMLLALAALAGCDDDATEPTLDPAELLIVNASEIDDLAVRRIGSESVLAEDLDSYEVPTACVEIPAGEHALVFTGSGVELALATAEFEAGMKYTAIFDVAGSTRRAAILSDDEQASAGNNALRFINATASPADVYVTPPGTDAAPAYRTIGNGPPFALTNDRPNYHHRSTEHTRVLMYDPGVTTGDPRSEFTLAGLPAGRLATVVLTDPGASSFLATPCS